MHTAPFSKKFSAFNTLNTISVHSPDHQALEEAVALCARFESLFSRTRPDSQLAAVNRAEGRPVSVDPELAAFIATALRYCEDSEGLFDITMGSVVDLWDFKRHLIPDERAIAEALAHVDHHAVRVEGSHVRIEDPRARIDLGGIAKGYIADRLVDLLKSRGVKSGIVNLGGNVVVIGGKPDGSPWRVGVRAPAPSWAEGGETAFATVELRDASAVTSGVYERAFERDGKLYHHILDPATGHPANTDLLSATVVSRSSLDGDGYTTALVSMGLDRALAFVEARPALEAVLVASDGAVYASSGIGSSIPFALLGEDARAPRS